MNLSKRANISLLLLAFSVCLGVLHVVRTPALDWDFDVTRTTSQTQDAPNMATVFEYEATAGSAHSPAIRMGSDGFSIIWFDGTRESHNDVIIKEAKFTKSNEQWAHSDTGKFFNKEELSKRTTPRQMILTLGNTIQYGADNNKVLATIVSIGGWAAASIAVIDMENGDPTGVRKLSLSPFLNRSHLVRSPTISYQDGTIAIPAYLELGNAYGEIIRLDREGRVRDKRRISQGKFAIQPMIVPLDAQNAVALMRNFDDHSDRLIASWTTDGARTWSDPELLHLPNPNAPVAAVLLSTGALLKVYNETPSILHLAVSQDQGRTWDTVHTLEEGGGDARYPSMSILPDGEILLTYSTDSKRGIKALVFNEAWALGG